MNQLTEQLAQGSKLQQQIAKLLRKRVDGARERYNARLQEAFGEHIAPLASSPAKMANLGASGGDYLADIAQRALIFWDTLRQRGNQFVAHQRAGLPPVLHFDYEMIVDARTFEQPVNYALLRIVPPKG